MSDFIDDSLETCPLEQIEYLIAVELGAIKRHLCSLSESMITIADLLRDIADREP